MTIDLKAVERTLNQSNEFGTAAFNAARRREYADAEKLFAQSQRYFLEACKLLGINKPKPQG